MRGPVVHEVDAVFLTDWYSETDELLATSGSRPPRRSGRAGCSLRLRPAAGVLYGEQPGVVQQTDLLRPASDQHHQPLLRPGESLLSALTTTVAGVAVELFVGEIGDQFFVFHAQHSYHAELLAAGVRIYLYPAPLILHAKHLSIDEQVALVGSSNMDMRSFQLNFELMVLVCGRAFTDAVRQVEDDYRRVSPELTEDEWAERSWGHGLVDGLTRLTSAVQ